MSGSNYIHREEVHDTSMSSLVTPTSLIEAALRREAFGEGMLAITAEGCLTAGATQKYPSVQRQFLEERKNYPPLQQRLLEIDPPRYVPIPPLTPSAAPLYPPSRWKDSNIPGNIGVSHKRKGENYSLHGNLGTGNPYSSYIFKAGDREETTFSDTLINRVEKRVTNEERKILRMQVAYALRRVKHVTSQARIRQYQTVLENYFIQHFHGNRSFKSEFFSCEEFAERMCKDMVDDVIVNKSALKDRIQALRRASSLPSIPALEEQIEKSRTLAKKETVHEKALKEMGEPEKLTDASQLTRGRTDYFRWDFDNAISAPPAKSDIPDNFIERFMEGKEGLLAVVDKRISNNTSKKPATRKK